VHSRAKSAKTTALAEAAAAGKFNKSCRCLAPS